MTTTKKVVMFPCPWCKGKGGYTERILDDGSGPYYPCYQCDDHGFIVRGSPTHRKLILNSDKFYGVIAHAAFTSVEEYGMNEEPVHANQKDREATRNRLVAQIRADIEALWDTYAEDWGA